MNNIYDAKEDESINYRALARKFADTAGGLLSTNRDEDVEYACLQLRKCIEALCYDLLKAYLKEVPLGLLETWQPKKVMDELQAIDDKAHETRRIFIGIDTDGSPGEEWQLLGEDRRLQISWAVVAYNKLGNFLHVPTIGQMRTGKVLSSNAVRERALKIHAELSHVLAAKIWNTNFVQLYNITCLECGAPIARRLEAILKANPREIACGNCGQIHEVEEVTETEVAVRTVPMTWTCQGCGIERSIERHQAKHGLDVSCPSCGRFAQLHLRQVWEVGVEPRAEIDDIPESR